MTIAVAQDDSAEGQAALAQAAREAAFRQTGLAVLHVFTSAEPAERVDVAALEQRIGGMLADAGHPTLSWRLHTVAGAGTRAESLIELTEQVHAQLLVVGSRRRTPIGKFLLGSTVQRVVLDSPVPVLVVKAAPRAPLPRALGPATDTERGVEAQL